LKKTDIKLRERISSKLQEDIWFTFSVGSLWLTIFISLYGYVTFTLHPENLSLHPLLPKIYGNSYQFFGQLQILLSLLVCLTLLRRLSFKVYAPALFGSMLVSLGFELAGTTTGFPFGPYVYTNLLGLKLFDHVPFLIPTSWFVMCLCSYAIVIKLFQSSSAFTKIALSALVMTSWDFTLDPAMSFLTPYWVWGTPGFFYGMPLLNLFGWYVTSAIIALIFHLLKTDRWLAGLSSKRFIHLYIANLSLPIGLIVLSRLWDALAVTCIFWALIFALSRAQRQREQPAQEFSKLSRA
jgi:uncharacterized membrane protein